MNLVSQSFWLVLPPLASASFVLLLSLARSRMGTQLDFLGRQLVFLVSGSTSGMDLLHTQLWFCLFFPWVFLYPGET